MRGLRYVAWAILVLPILWGTNPAMGQEANEAVRVGFVVSDELQPALPTDPGPDGVSRFASIFRELGGQPFSLSLNRPIPDRISIVILVRPLEQLSLRDTAYIYQFLERGGQLLLALDPDNYFEVNTRFDRTGLDSILLNDYGVNFQSTLLIEPWFTIENLSINNLNSSQFAAHPEDFLPHPITAPLVRYELPVQLWGGRSVFVEPFGIGSFANSLLYNDTAYGETASRLFQAEEPDPLEYNIGEDPIGRLPIGSIGLNTENGSSVIILGDSELLQNGFGLEFLEDPSRPLYPGNFLFAERLAAWLLRLPPNNYPAPPEGFTWLAMDGNVEDWGELGILDVTTDLQAVYNDHFLYVRINTNGVDATPINQVTLSLPAPNTAEDNQTVVNATTDVVTVDGEVVPDAVMVVGDEIEIRFPLRLTADVPSVDEICINEVTCLGGLNRLVELETLDPVPVRIPNAPYTVVRSTQQVNLRQGPGTNFGVKSLLSNGTPVSLVGRNEAGTWFFVRSGAFEGWLATIVIPNTANIEQLEVFPSP